MKTASALGVYCATVVTAITAQNTYEVTRVYSLPPEVISAQIDAVFSDLCVWSVKTGMLGSGETILAVAKGLERWAAGVPVIVDPVMVSTTGTSLLEAGAQQTLVEKLMPMAALVTPNLEEAAALTGSPVARDEEEAKEQAAKLLALGPRAVLLKGGHGSDSEARDLYYDGKAIRVLFGAPYRDGERRARNRLHAGVRDRFPACPWISHGGGYWTGKGLCTWSDRARGRT